MLQFIRTLFGLCNHKWGEGKTEIHDKYMNAEDKAAGVVWSRYNVTLQFCEKCKTPKYTRFWIF